MRTKLSFPALIAISLLATGTIASAQVNTGGGTPGSAGVIGSPAAPPVQQNTGSAGISSAPGSASTSATGAGSTTGMSMKPGSIGTTTGSPSGLPGDNPSAPGFPGKVGR